MNNIFLASDFSRSWVHLLAVALASFEVDITKLEEGIETSTAKLKFWDKLLSLNDLAKHLGMFDKDNTQRDNPLIDILNSVSGKSQGPPSER